MSIRAVIFDVGGVLSRTTDFSPHARWAARLGMTVRDLALLVYENEVARRATIGQATPDEVWAHVAQVLALAPEDVAQLKADFWSTAEWDHDLLAFVASLRPRCKTGILSDAWGNARAVMAPSISPETFDVIMFSAEEGLQKPDPAIFERILARLAVAPGEAIFVDDRPANVEAATRLGMHGVLFTDAADVRAQVEALLASA